MPTNEPNGRPPENSQDLAMVIAQNLKKLMTENNITQKDLAKQLDVAQASMTEYCKGRRVPNVEFFVSLKNQYDISIDDFLTRSITPSSAGRNVNYDEHRLQTYHKYCGSYFMYYFDTSKYKGRNNLQPPEALLYGILHIYPNQTSLAAPEFSCAAILGIKSREEVVLIKKKLDSLGDSADIVDYIARGYASAAYFGNFELSLEHAFVSLRHANMDKALAIFHRVDNNKPNYTGGIGTINSISKGRRRMPVIQYLGLARHPLSMSVEEIHNCLLLGHPTYRVDVEAKKMLDDFNKLNAESGVAAMNGFSEHQKDLMIHSILERSVKKSLERNMFRYGKISDSDDDDWYHAIKAAYRLDD